MPRLKGAIAAAVTPLKDQGLHLDLEGVANLASFLAGAGVDGLLACGTTGEGMLLSVNERKRVAEGFLRSRQDGFQVAVHAGAQTTADTVALASHALGAGADAVAVIAPPYFPLDGEELLRHFVAAADACDPLPFYVYEFEARSGYAIPLTVIERLRDRAPNLAGLKVSDTPFERVEPYLVEGLDVFIGFETLVLLGMDAGAIGSVSGLASAWPETVAALVHEGSTDAHRRVNELRDGLAGIPFHAALKHVLANRDILLHEDVRAPLRPLTDEERALVSSL